MNLPPPPRPIIYSPDLSPLAKEAAIWIYGGYPQERHETAEAILMQKCVTAGFDWIGAAALWCLHRDLTKDLKE